MPKNNKIFIFLLCLAGILISCKNEKEQKEQKKMTRPNIVFMMSDDHAYQAISAYNNKLIQTPNIDRLANEGMLFTNASVTNSICAPSRAVILTGKHSHMNGKIDNLRKFDTTNVTFPQLLQDAGYQTAIFGKLHFGNNPKGFDEFKILPGQGRYYNPKFITKSGDTVIDGYVTDIITDLTLQWLEEERDPKKPFLLMYLHKAPHRAWLPAERHYKEFTKKEFPLPETLFDDYTRIHKKDLKSNSREFTSQQYTLEPPRSHKSTAARTAEMNILTHMVLTNDNKLKDSVVKKLGIQERYLGDPTSGMSKQQKAAWDSVYSPINKEFADNYRDMDDRDLMIWKYQRYMQDYLGTIAAVDENVGRVLNYLDENNLSNNTIVVYTSDQGFYLGEHGWFDKRFMYDESFKTPLLIRWPNEIKPGITQDEMVQNLDFAQTFLEIASVQAPEEMQGESLLPLLKGKEDTWEREAVYYHYYEYPAEHAVKRHYGIATKDYKLIHFYYDVEEWELYDRKNDPQEMHNVFYDPGYAEVRKKMMQKLVEVRKKYKDSEELDKHFIELYQNK